MSPECNIFFQRDPSFLKEGKKGFWASLPIHHIPSTSLLRSPRVLVWPVNDHTAVMVKQPPSASCLVSHPFSLISGTVRSMYVYSHVCALARRKHLFWQRETLTDVAEDLEGSRRSPSQPPGWAALWAALARHTRGPGRPDSARPLSQGRPVFLPSLKPGLKRWRGTVLPRFLRTKVLLTNTKYLGKLGITYWEANFFA